MARTCALAVPLLGLLAPGPIMRPHDELPGTPPALAIPLAEARPVMPGGGATPCGPTRRELRFGWIVEETQEVRPLPRRGVTTCLAVYEFAADELAPVGAQP